MTEEQTAETNNDNNDNNDTEREPTLEEKIEQAMSMVKPNWVDRSFRAIAVIGTLASIVFLRTADAGWLRWLYTTLAGLLGLGLSETYGWVREAAEDERMREILMRAHRLYAKHGEDKARDYLRDELAKFRKEELVRQSKFERQVGDVDAVATQAAQAKRDASEAERMVKKAADGVEKYVDRIDGLDKKIDGLDKKMTGMINGIDSRLAHLNDAHERIGAVEDKINSLNDNLSSAAESFNAQITDMNKKTKTMAGSITRLDKKIDRAKDVVATTVENVPSGKKGRGRKAS